MDYFPPQSHGYDTCSNFIITLSMLHHKAFEFLKKNSRML